MKTFKQLQIILNENRKFLDPVGMPQEVLNKLTGHRQMEYKMMWKRMGLPLDFEERIIVMGGETNHNGFDFGSSSRKEGDFPVTAFWYENGHKASEFFFYKNGKEHRDGDKPAVIVYDANGKIIKKEFWKNGKQYTP